MLTPEQIAALRDWAGHIADPINDFLLEDIARRIAKAGQLTSSASYQVWRAQELGMSQREIKKKLKKLLRVSNKELRQLLTQSAEVGYDFDIKRFPQVQAVSFSQNESLQGIVRAAVAMAQKDLENITQTLGMVDPYGKALPLRDAYRSCMDYAFKQVFTGATDYNTAIRQATKHLADKGTRVIDYESGVHTSLEAATRRNIMGGLGLMQEQITAATHDDMGCDGWEISAHANSAPDHEPIQGKQYSDAEYQSLNNSLVRRISTLNCGHVAFPIILGVNEPQYTPEQLQKFRDDNAKGITYAGKHYTGYEATQMQRRLERSIRKQKNRILTDEAAGDKDKLLQDQIKLQRLRQEYRQFSKAAGLRTEDERLYVSGFGRGEAARSSAAAKKQIALIDSFQEGMASVGYSTQGFDYYTGDVETLRQMQSAFTQMASDFPEEAQGLTIRLRWTDDTDTIGWFDDKSRTINYNRALFKNWGTAQKEYADRVQSGHFPAGTDAKGCFYHEFGHAVWFARGGGSLRKAVDNTLLKLGYGRVNVSQRKELLRKVLSIYASETTSPAYQEVIAEAFSEWYNSDKPRDFCKEFLKEVGVIGDV